MSRSSSIPSFRTAAAPRIAGLALVAWAFLGVACDDGETTHLYRTEPHAPSLTDESVANLDTLGAILIDRGANFSVYSNRATRIELLLFDDPESAQPTRRFPLARFGDVWNLYVEGVGLGQHYGYVAWGPNWPYDSDWYPGSVKGFITDVDADGNRFNPNKLLFDPYSIALHRDHDWSKGSCASGPDRAVSTWAAGAKSVIVASQYAWTAGETTWLEQRKDPEMEGHRFQDLIVYEVHLKGFTMDDASGVLHPGTFRGMGENAAYLKELGVNAVELLPVFEKPLDGGYWGYNTIGFFAPELTYAAEHDLAEGIDEFKWMVDQLHQQGVEVILDVVYNHTGEGGFWRSKIALDDVNLGSSELVNFDEKEVTTLLSFRGLDNAAYYYLEDDKAYFWNGTGVGNSSRSNSAAGRRLIMDSLRYWVEEMHVDGFRFDLAPLLGVSDEDPTQWAIETSVLQDVLEDPFFQERNIRLIAEPWALGQYQLGGFTKSATKPEYAYGEWNGNFRDLVRAFVNYDDVKLNAGGYAVDLGGALTGSYALFGDDGRLPYHSVNFVTAHDGFTMYDVVSYDEKVNGCGPLNPVCCDDPSNPFCETDNGEDYNRSRDWGADQEGFKRQLVRDFFALLLISHGTPMILGGDEWMRTQLGNNNAYSTMADNRHNWFQWGAWQADPGKVRMHDFVAKMNALRKAHAYAFAPADYASGAAAFAWKTPGNGEMTDWGQKSVMLHYYNVGTNPELLILVNMETADVTFTLPSGRLWRRLVDTQQYFDTDEYFGTSGADATESANIELDTPEPVTDAYTAKSRTVVILEGTGA